MEIKRGERRILRLGEIAHAFVGGFRQNRGVRGAEIEGNASKLGAISGDVGGVERGKILFLRGIERGARTGRGVGGDILVADEIGADGDQQGGFGRLGQREVGAHGIERPIAREDAELGFEIHFSRNGLLVGTGAGED